MPLWVEEGVSVGRSRSVSWLRCLWESRHGIGRLETSHRVVAVFPGSDVVPKL